MYAALTSALYHRERTGRGTQVASSLLANGLWANSYLATAALCGNELIPRPPREQAYNALSSYYQCADGKWLLLTILNEDRHWPVLVKCVGREDLLEDPRFATKPDRLRNSVALIAILDEAFGARERTHWTKELHDNGIVFDIVATPEDIPHDQQVKDNGYAVSFPENPSWSTIDSPFTVRGVEKVAPRLPPAIGQHTDEILRDAGFTAEDIDGLRTSGTVA